MQSEEGPLRAGGLQPAALSMGALFSLTGPMGLQAGGAQELSACQF